MPADSDGVLKSLSNNSFLIFLIGQLVLFTIWAVRLDGRVAVLETTQVLQDKRVDQIDSTGTRAQQNFIDRVQVLEMRDNDFEARLRFLERRQ